MLETVVVDSRRPDASQRARAIVLGDPLEDQMWESFLQQSIRLRRRLIEPLERCGLLLTDYQALGLCIEHTASPTEIAQRVGVTAAGATEIIDRLEVKGFVRRLAHPTDRRSTRVEVTPSGRTLYRNAHRACREVLNEISHRMTPTGRSALSAGIADLQEAIDQSRDG
jgi:DNA-binding MarR family transcriptional regulator